MTTKFTTVTLLGVLLLPTSAPAQAGRANAQTPQTPAVAPRSNSPLMSAELVALVRRLRTRPDLKETVVEEIRRRGIGFALTSGLRSVVATQSGNDADLRRTLEEAERRRAGVVTAPPPPAAEAAALIERARAAVLEQASQMPDFIVRQQIARSYAYGTTKNWLPNDRLTVGVTYREKAGEQYRLLAVNGLPVPGESVARDSYQQAQGTSSTGEFASRLANLFDPASEAVFRAVDTDTLPQGRAIVYEYRVKLEKSKEGLKYGGGVTGDGRGVAVGSQGKIWIDRETARVWRIENTATDIPADFPIRAALNRIDYDWTVIDERKYLLPRRAEVELTSAVGDRVVQSRNDIRFRNYQKFGSKVEILDDDIGEEPPPADDRR